MKCPRCKTTDLRPTMIEENLPAMACPACEGSLVSLLYYRHWAETQRPSLETRASSTSHLPLVSCFRSLPSADIV